MSVSWPLLRFRKIYVRWDPAIARNIHDLFREELRDVVLSTMNIVFAAMTMALGLSARVTNLLLRVEAVLIRSMERD
jgi:hypothetical protein